MQLKRIKRNNLTDKERQVLKILGLSLSLIGGVLCIGKIAYNYYNEKQTEKIVEDFLKLDEEEVAYNLASMTAIKEEVLDSEDIAIYIII